MASERRSGWDPQPALWKAQVLVRGQEQAFWITSGPATGAFTEYLLYSRLSFLPDHMLYSRPQVWALGLKDRHSKGCQESNRRVSGTDSKA